MFYWKQLISINVSQDAILRIILAGKNHCMFLPSPIPTHIFCDKGFSFFSHIQEHVQSNFQSLFVHWEKPSLQRVSAETFFKNILYQKAFERAFKITSQHRKTEHVSFGQPTVPLSLKLLVALTSPSKISIRAGLRGDFMWPKWKYISLKILLWCRRSVFLALYSP